MSLKDIALVRAYHDDRIQRFGTEASEALGWKNRESQQHRFEELAQIGDLRGRSVLDVGCGHGDLYPYLKQRHGQLHYTGIDNVGAFLEVAVRRFGEETNTRFLLGEFGSQQLPQTDFVICCGALNYRNSDSDYLYRMIKRFFDATSIGLGLNLLKKVDFSAGILARFDPNQVADFCRRLTSRVEVRVDQDENYFTLFLYREGNPIA